VLESIQDEPETLLPVADLLDDTEMDEEDDIGLNHGGKYGGVSMIYSPVSSIFFSTLSYLLLHHTDDLMEMEVTDPTPTDVEMKGSTLHTVDAPPKPSHSSTEIDLTNSDDDENEDEEDKSKPVPVLVYSNDMNEDDLVKASSGLLELARRDRYKFGAHQELLVDKGLAGGDNDQSLIDVEDNVLPSLFSQVGKENDKINLSAMYNLLRVRPEVIEQSTSPAVTASPVTTSPVTANTKHVSPFILLEGDVERVQDGNWFNDVIVNFFMKW